MKVENTEAQMRKGILELCVLSIASGDAKYPSDILQKLKTSQLIVVEGTLYPLLSRLNKAGMLSYEWQESEMGPPRKYYKITDDGNQFLEKLKEHWESLQSAVTNILSPTKQEL